MNKIFGIFSGKIIEKENIYQIKEKIIHEHLSGINDLSFQLWILFIFQKWYKKSFIN